MYSKKKNVEKSACVGAYWSIGTTSLEFYEGNMDSQKYVSILQNKINKLKKCLKMEIAIR